MTGVILAVHSALAALTSIPEFNLEKEEAAKLADASKEVLKFYPLGMSDKALAWINLGVVACGVYGTRVMAYSMRRGAERRERIHTLPPTGPSRGGTPTPPRDGPAQAEPRVNGHAGGGGINLDDLTPAWMAVAPEGEVLP